MNIYKHEYKASGLCAIDLSCDQKPDRPDERRRILEQGGRVMQGAFPVYNPITGPRMERAGHANAHKSLSLAKYSQITILFMILLDDQLVDALNNQ